MKHINQILLTISHAESLRNSTSLHCACSAPHGAFNFLNNAEQVNTIPRINLS